MHLPSSLPGVLLFIILVAIAELTTAALLPHRSSFPCRRLSVLPPWLCSALYRPPDRNDSNLITTLIAEIADRRRGRPRALWCSESFSTRPLLSAGCHRRSSVHLARRPGRPGGCIDQPAAHAPGRVIIEIANGAFVVGASRFKPASQPFKSGCRMSRGLFHSTSWECSSAAVGWRWISDRRCSRTDCLLSAIVLTIYAFRLYVGQTKAQMARLEKIIAERTDNLLSVNKELVRLDRLKASFFSVINHEMRSPLTAIIGYTALLLAMTLWRVCDQKCCARSRQRPAAVGPGQQPPRHLAPGRWQAANPAEVVDLMDLVIKPSPSSNPWPKANASRSRSMSPARSHPSMAIPSGWINIDQPAEQRRQVYARHRLRYPVGSEGRCCGQGQNQCD